MAECKRIDPDPTNGPKCGCVDGVCAIAPIASTIHFVEVFVGEDAVRLIRVENVLDENVALELALEHVRDNVGGEVRDDEPSYLASLSPDIVIDAATAEAITDATMVAGAVQAGQAWQQRVDTDPKRAAEIHDRITGLLIFDETEAAVIVAAFAALGLNGAVATPLREQLKSWLATIPTEVAETA